MDKIVIGGGMMFTFLKAMGYEIGSSIVEMEVLDTARTIMTHAREKGVKFYLPVDCVVANRVSPDAEIRIVPVQEIPPGYQPLESAEKAIFDRIFVEKVGKAIDGWADKVRPHHQVEIFVVKASE